MFFHFGFVFPQIYPTNEFISNYSIYNSRKYCVWKWHKPKKGFGHTHTHEQLISLVLPLSVLVLFRYPVGVILAPPLPTHLLPTLTIGHPAFLPPLFPVTSLLWSLLLPTLDKYLLPLQPYRQIRMQKKKKKKKWRWKLPRVEGHHRLIGRWSPPTFCPV